MLWFGLSSFDDGEATAPLVTPVARESASLLVALLTYSIRRIKVVIRYIPAVSVTASGLASFASLQTDFRHALSRPSGMVVRESCDPSELQHLDVVTSSALVFLLSEKYRRKCKMRFAAHAHKFVDDDHIEELLGRARCSGDLDIPAAPADIEHAATPPAKGLSTLKPSAIKAPHREWATLCDRAREIAQHLFTRLIPQVSAVSWMLGMPAVFSEVDIVPYKFCCATG